MHFLITNDDGITAPGLAALVEAAAQFGEVTVLAPDREWSGCGHQTTTNRPLRVTEQAPGWFSCDGTPADCVRLGVVQIAPQVDWVLSGINAGGNLGVDTFMSGTVAAAREAMLLGKPAIALSQYCKRGLARNWPRSSLYSHHVLSQLLTREVIPQSFWNVNFPDLVHVNDAVEPLPALLPSTVDHHPLPIGFEALDGGFLYRSNYHLRPQEPGGDVETCFGGQISLSLIRQKTISD